MRRYTQGLCLLAAILIGCLTVGCGSAAQSAIASLSPSRSVSISSSPSTSTVTSTPSPVVSTTTATALPSTQSAAASTLPSSSPAASGGSGTQPIRALILLAGL